MLWLHRNFLSGIGCTGDVPMRSGEAGVR